MPRTTKQKTPQYKGKFAKGMKSKPNTKYSNLKKYVDRMISSKTETKVISLTNTQIYNSTISSTSELYNIIPNIAEGTADNNRIGNSIDLMYTNSRGYITFSTASPNTYGSLDVCLYHLISKRNRDGSNRVSSDLNIIKNGTVKGQYDGTLASSLAPINTEDFVIISKKNVKLIPLPFNQPASTALPTTSSNIVANPNSGTITYKFKLSINWKKVLKNKTKVYYDTNVSSQPTSLNSFYCLGFAQYNDPTNPASFVDALVKMSYFSETYYKDA